MVAVFTDPEGATLTAETEETLRAVLRAAPSGPTSVTKMCSMGPSMQSAAAMVDAMNAFAVRPGMYVAILAIMLTRTDFWARAKKFRS